MMTKLQKNLELDNISNVKTLSQSEQYIGFCFKEDLVIIDNLIDEITHGKKTKEDYKNVLNVIKKDKKLKNYLIDKVVDKIFGKGKLSFLIKISIKLYLSTKFGL